MLKGDFERGYTQLQEAYGHLPQPPEWYWGPIGLVALSRDDVPGLITAGNRVTTTGYALGVIVKLLSLHLAGDVTRDNRLAVAAAFGPAATRQ